MIKFLNEAFNTVEELATAIADSGITVDDLEKATSLSFPTIADYIQEFVDDGRSLDWMQKVLEKKFDKKIRISKNTKLNKSAEQKEKDVEKTYSEIVAALDPDDWDDIKSWISEAATNVVIKLPVNENKSSVKWMLGKIQHWNERDNTNYEPTYYNQWGVGAEINLSLSALDELERNNPMLYHFIKYEWKVQKYDQVSRTYNYENAMIRVGHSYRLTGVELVTGLLDEQVVHLGQN